MRQQPKALPAVPPCPVVTACSLHFSDAVQSGLMTSSPGWRGRNSLRVTLLPCEYTLIKKIKVIITCIRKDASLKALFDFGRRIGNQDFFKPKRQKTGMLMSVEEGIAVICRLSCLPEGQYSCEVPENSCSRQDSFSRVHQ